MWHRCVPVELTPLRLAHEKQQIGDGLRLELLPREHHEALDKADAVVAQLLVEVVHMLQVVPSALA